MAQALVTLEETMARIASGRPLLLAGDERMLRQLPPGAWIGGTIPYFMSERGGTFSQELIFVTEFPDDITTARIATYDPPVGPAARAYVARHLADPAFRRWRAEGLIEESAHVNCDLDLPTRPWPHPG